MTRLRPKTKASETARAPTFDANGQAYFFGLAPKTEQPKTRNWSEPNTKPNWLTIQAADKEQKTDTKTVYLIETGGTIVSTGGKGEKAPASEDILGKILPEIANNIEIVIRRADDPFINVDSTNFDPKLHCGPLAEMIYDLWKNKGADAVVISHGTDTKEESAPQLAYMLKDLPIPIVVTGSQRSARIKKQDGTEIENPEWDGKRNLADAFLTAKTVWPGVYVTFGGKIMLGTRVHKWSSEDLQPFKSKDFPDVGRIEDGIMDSKRICLTGIRPYVEEQLPLFPGFPNTAINTNIFSIAMSQSIPLKPETMEAVIKEYDGVIITGFGSGNVINIPNDLERDWHGFISRLIESGKPVLITTRCESGKVEPDYEVAPKEAIFALDMTEGAAIAKFRSVLWRYRPINSQEKIENIRKFMQNNIVGEIVDEKIVEMQINNLIESYLNNLIESYLDYKDRKEVFEWIHSFGKIGINFLIGILRNEKDERRRGALHLIKKIYLTRLAVINILGEKMQNQTWREGEAEVGGYFDKFFEVFLDILENKKDPFRYSIMEAIHDLFHIHRYYSPTYDAFITSEKERKRRENNEDFVTGSLSEKTTHRLINILLKLRKERTKDKEYYKERSTEILWNIILGTGSDLFSALVIYHYDPQHKGLEQALLEEFISENIFAYEGFRYNAPNKRTMMLEPIIRLFVFLDDESKAKYLESILVNMENTDDKDKVWIYCEILQKIYGPPWGDKVYTLVMHRMKKGMVNVLESMAERQDPEIKKKIEETINLIYLY